MGSHWKIIGKQKHNQRHIIGKPQGNYNKTTEQPEAKNVGNKLITIGKQLGTIGKQLQNHRNTMVKQ